MDFRSIVTQRPIYLVGYMGAGKSTVGRKLSSFLQATFIDTDLYLENRFRKTISQMFQEEGEECFRRRESMALQELSGYSCAVISTGGGLACFNGNMDLMLSSGITVYLQYTPKTLAKRLMQLSKSSRPLIKNFDELSLLSYVYQTLEEREPFYRKANLLIPCEVVCPDGNERQLAEYILSLLKEPLFLQQIETFV